MAEIKKRILIFNSGKQVKLYGNSIAIAKSMELSEGYAPNILGYGEMRDKEKPVAIVHNPHNLSTEELQELADYNIRLWLDFKDAVRAFGSNNIKIFKKDAMI